MNARHEGIRTLLAALAILLPGRLRRLVHTRLLGYVLDPTAAIGRSFVDVERLTMGPGATIGSLTIVRGCQDVELARDAHIGHLNMINGIRRSRDVFPGLDRHPALIMGELAHIQSMHFLDCSDRIEFARGAGLAGIWTAVLTHSFDPRTMRQGVLPVHLGERVVVATRCTLLPGASVADGSIVATGATVTGALTENDRLYGGSPARVIGDLDPDRPVRTTKVLR